MRDASSDLRLYQNFTNVNTIAPELYERFDVKRGLRNADGTGVVAGLTNIANVHGYQLVDGVRQPDAGRLDYRGHDIAELVSESDQDRRFNFEEVAYLLLLGKLPNDQELAAFIAELNDQR